MRKYFFFGLVRTVQAMLVVFFISCSQEKSRSESVSEKVPLFSVLGMEKTGLNFINKIEESTTMNGFYYEYFYNGGGVAVADFNNDGLQDIYFTSNLRTNKLYLNEGGLKFKNVSVKANVQGKGGFSTGVTVVDINNDGLKDIYILKSGQFETDEPLRNELYVNKGLDNDNVPFFEESARAYGLDLPHYSTQATFFDYDRDGDLDMFLINHNIEMYHIDELQKVKAGESEKIGEKLFRNDNGKFVNVTKAAGIISNNIGFGLGISIGDVNNDGWPDVYTGNDYYEKDHLYLNNTDGTFTESSLESFNHISTFSMGNDIADINNDGLMDIVSLDMMAEDNYTQKTSMSGMNVANFYEVDRLGLHHQYMYNTLQINNGVYPGSKVPAFSDVAQLANISSTDWSWAPLLFDMDNDGYRDLFVTNGIKRDFRNNDFSIYLQKKYQENIRKNKVDLAKYIDDLLDKMPSRKKENYLFLNTSDLNFEKVALSQPETFSNGAAYADFDNDGDLDIVVNNIDDFAHIYRNNSSNTSFLNIRLKGSENNIDAIGAKIEVSLPDKTLIAENYYSRGFQSAMAGPIHFGLGSASSVDSVRVFWPDGKYQVVQNIDPDQTLEISYHTSEEFEVSTNIEYKFNENATEYGIDFVHSENEYNDFDRESLMPHKMSQFGPALSVADLNGDGREDFFIGGARGQSGAIFFQSEAGTFKKSTDVIFEEDKNFEDTGALFFDADGDGDRDLYVVSGGNEEPEGSEFYQDRLYLNDGQGMFSKSPNAIPQIMTSGIAVRAADYDKDGDLDLFIGSRVNPMNYGVPVKSFLLENRSTPEKVHFKDVTESEIPALLEYGMVTDALWADIDNDATVELIIAQEWGSIDIFKRVEREFTNISKQWGLTSEVGWWYGLSCNDIDQDGDLDLVAGNLGLNYKYKASSDKPFHLYVNDFDKNKTNDIVLGYEQNNTTYPLRGRECTSNQMPFIKKKFKTYDAFAKASLQEVYGTALESSIHRAATNFSTCILENVNNQGFRFRPLPNEVQISAINKILFADVEENGKEDMLLFGNLYGSEVETPRNDASYGHYVRNLGNMQFEVVKARKSGLFVRGDVRAAAFISIDDSKRKAVLVARNDDSLLLLEM